MGGEGRRVGEDRWERAGSPTPSRLAPLHSVQPAPLHSAALAPRRAAPAVLLRLCREDGQGGWGRRGGHGGGRDRRVGSGGEGEGNRRRERRKVGRGGEEWMGGVVREEIRSRGSDKGRDKDGSRWDSLMSAPRVVVEAAWVPYVCASARLAVPKSLP